MTDRSEPETAAQPYEVVNGRDFANYWSQVDDCYADRVNSFDYYTKFIDELRHAENIEFRPLNELFHPVNSATRAVGLRHDIDADPITALRCARYLARVGIAGSFYLLHSAPYYGDFHRGTFVRNPEIAQWIKAMIVYGCEIGIHNDVMGIESFGFDGPASLVEELRWLRALGADIRGTVAHNSLPTYGAENYEVFAGRELVRAETELDDRRPRLPIGKLDEAELNLHYEGTFAKPRASIDKDSLHRFMTGVQASIRSEAWMRSYLLDNPYCEWESDAQLWLTGTDEWVFAAQRQDDQVFEFGIGFDRAVEAMKSMPPETRTLILIHPVYVRGK